MIRQHFPELVAILPALNEAQSITKVIEAIGEFSDVLVVDDGSTDRTCDLAKAAGALTISHPVNRGYDQALESGLFTAASKGYKFAVTLDADGQHNPYFISLFFDELQEGSDIVVGVRDRKQRWAETLFSFISKSLWGIDDPLCGMKGYRLDLIRSIGVFNTYSSVGTELSIRAFRSGFRISNVPIITSRRNGVSRFGGGLKANLRILRAAILGMVLAKSFDSSL
ncbi:glycosyl transferase 2 family protein [Synechococcus sp. A18-40]|nr:glycosyl transferase 2 family protein [Synechococcus sp. A18-40]